MDNVAEKHGCLETPIGDSNKGPRRDTRVIAAEPRQYAEAEQAVSDRFAEGRVDRRMPVQRVVVARQLCEISDVVRSDFTFGAQPAIADRQVFEMKRLQLDSL